MKLNRKQKKGFRYWAPRVMAIVFVVLMYFVFLNDFLSLLNNYPVLYDFFVGTMTLALTILVWGKNSKFAGVIFVATGVLYPFLLWHRILIASIIMISVWLVLIGLLFFLDPTESIEKRRKSVESFQREYEKSEQ